MGELKEREEDAITLSSSVPENLDGERHQNVVRELTSFNVGLHQPTRNPGCRLYPSDMFVVSETWIFYK